MPNAQYDSAHVLGFLAIYVSAPAADTTALNAAASGGYSQNWLAFSFVPNDDRTVNAVVVRCTAVNGTLGATDLACDIFSDSSGLPGTSQGGTTTVTTTPTGAAWVEFTGLSVALTAGTQYWIVLRNANATPTTNYPTYGCLGSALNNTNINAPQKKASTDGGSTWGGTSRTGIVGYRLQYSDSSYSGYPASSQSTDSTNTVYSARSVGAYFTSPGVDIKVSRVKFLTAKTGSPTGNPQVQIYTGETPSLLATSSSIPLANVAASLGYHTFYFSTPAQIPASSIVRVVLSETTQSDASGNNYNSAYYNIDTSSPSLTLAPFGGWQQTYYNGSSWSETAGRCPLLALILDTNTPFL